MEKILKQAKAFYVIITISLILGLSLIYIGLSPIKALNYSAIPDGLMVPVMIAIILHISNDKKNMGNYTNGKKANIFGFIALILMSAAAVTSIFKHLFEKYKAIHKLDLNIQNQNDLF